MAMTKKERAEFEALEERLRINAALARIVYDVRPLTGEEIKALPTAKLNCSGWRNGQTVTPVWNTGGYFGASLGWTDGSIHSKDDPKRTNAIGSQTAGGPWFATKLDALKYFRMKEAERMAAELAKIDKWIEGEIEAAAGGGDES